ncbi:hypothetical protein DFH09DRAFT_232909 [Mycena vulgaris]|nr:hypothetical protein DFH09DRAFT_232909 [Mycena vulgaris]
MGVRLPGWGREDEEHVAAAASNTHSHANAPHPTLRTRLRLPIPPRTTPTPSPRRMRKRGEATSTRARGPPSFTRRSTRNCGAHTAQALSRFTTCRVSRHCRRRRLSPRLPHPVLLILHRLRISTQIQIHRCQTSPACRTGPSRPRISTRTRTMRAGDVPFAVAIRLVV